MEKICCNKTELVLIGNSRTCISCGTVDMDSLFYEDMHADELWCEESDNPLTADRFHAVTVVQDRQWKGGGKRETFRDRWFRRMNVMITYTSQQRVAHRLRMAITDVVHSLGLFAPDAIIHDASAVINEWVLSGENRTTTGDNRLGVVAFCVYRAARLNEDTTLTVVHACTALNIRAPAFHCARKRLYRWNERVRRCDWFLRSDENPKVR